MIAGGKRNFKKRFCSLRVRKAVSLHLKKREASARLYLREESRFAGP